MLIAGVIIFLVLSAFFSGSETAFVVASRLRVELKKRKGHRGASLAQRLLDNPEQFIVTTLVGNNIAVVVFSSLTAVLLAPLLPQGTIIVVSTSVLLLFGEILPKNLFRERASSLAPIVAYPLRAFELIFYPLNEALKSLVTFVLREKQSQRRESFASFSRKDFSVILRESVRAGSIDMDERDTITRLFRLVRRKVKTVMVPRTEIVAIPKTASVARARRIFLESGFSRLPVFDKDLDHIVGMIAVHDLFRFPESITEVLRQPFFVPETKTCFDLFLDLRKPDRHIALVLDEHGGISGLVSIEDLVEVIFGEIQDEHDSRLPYLKAHEDGSIVADGRVEVDALNAVLQDKIPLGDYATVAGWILFNTGKILRTGQTAQIGVYEVEIKKATRKRIERVKMRKKVPEQEEGETQ